MEEDDYYLDNYDCQTSKPPPPPPTSSAALPISSRQNSTESSDDPDGPMSLTPPPNGEDEDYYEDDYDHLYAVDTDGAEQYLREIWTQLGVGHNGYLNLGELYRVCEHIGMSASEDMIEQLFDKLDNDQDGRVSFAEFVEGLFKYVHKTAHAQSAVTPASYQQPISSQLSPNQSLSSHLQSSNLDYNANFANSPTSSSSFLNNVTTYNASPVPAQSTPPLSTESSPSHIVNPTSSINPTGPNSPTQTSEPSSPAHRINRSVVMSSSALVDCSNAAFITIPTDKDGYTESRKILKLWQTLGFNVASTNGDRLLKNFGFNSKQYLNVYELWSQMEDKLYHGNDSELYQICLATFLNEFTQLKITHEHLTDKCERLQSNLSEANSRAEFLAAEVDEQHLRMEQSSNDKMLIIEKKYQDQIRIIETESSKEKEMMIVQSCHLRQDAEKQMGSLQEQMAKLRKNVLVLEEENKRLEKEYHRIHSQNGDLQRNCLEMQRQVEEASHLHAKIVELESYESLMEDQQYQDLVKEVERLKYQNKSLQDQNDELLVEKDSLRQQLEVHHSRQHQQIVLLPTGQLDGSQPSGGVISNRNKRKRRRKRNKHKNPSQSAQRNSENSVQNSENPKESLDSKDQFDDNMSTISTATVDTCTTIDTDAEHGSASTGQGVHLRSHSRLSRSNSSSQVEKRQRILFRNSRHSLDDEPLPLEEPEVLENPEYPELQETNWDLSNQETILKPETEVYEEAEEDEDEEEDDDEMLDEEPRTLVELSSSGPHYSSLSDEISEWASVRDRKQKSKSDLKQVIEKLFSGSEDSGPKDLVKVALDKIKQGLHIAMMDVMDRNAQNQTASGTFNPFTQLDQSQDMMNSESQVSVNQLSQLFSQYLTESNQSNQIAVPNQLSLQNTNTEPQNQRIAASTQTSQTNHDQNNNPALNNGKSSQPTTPLTPSGDMEWNSI